MSAILCFYFNIGLPGITLGFTIGSISMAVLFYITITFFCDWEQIARDVRKKMLDNGHGQKEGLGNDELKASLLH